MRRRCWFRIWPFDFCAGEYQSCSAGGRQGWVRVDRAAVVGMKLEVEVVGTSVCVAGVADIANDCSLANPGSGSEPRDSGIEMGVVEAGPGALEPDSDSTEPAIAAPPRFLLH